jgi:hypothetical protein
MHRECGRAGSSFVLGNKLPGIVQGGGTKMFALSIKRSLALATGIAIAVLLLAVTAQASAYMLSFTATNFPPTGHWEWEQHWTYFGGDLGSGSSGTLDAGLTDYFISPPGATTDFRHRYVPPDLSEPQSFVLAACLIDDPGAELWQYTDLDNQGGSVTFAGFKAGTQDLYTAVSLNVFETNNAHPSFVDGQTFQVTNGNIAGMTGVKISRNPITVDTNALSGFATTGSWYSGSVVVNAIFNGRPVPEPSSVLALLGGIGALGGFALRRRKQ